MVFPRCAAVFVLLAGSSVFAAQPARAQVGTCPSTATLDRTGPYSAIPWAQQLLDPRRVWPLTDGSRETVAVVDSGVDTGNPALAGGQVQDGHNLVAGGTGASALLDCADHGTGVAGIIAGRPVPGSGFTGLAPGASVLAVKVADQAGDIHFATIAAGITKAVDAGASVVNVSIEATSPDPDLEAAVRYAAQRDVVIVAAAGNENSANVVTGNPKIYPASYDAAYPNVLAVGAIDSKGERASFSETATPVSVVAPGVDIVAPGAGGTGAASLVDKSGTSFAAPFVAATAALVRAHDTHLSAAEVVHRIEVTADHPAGSLPDPAFGWGTVDPYAAVTAVIPDAGPAVGTPKPSAIAVPPPVVPRKDDSARIAGITAAAGAGIVVVVLGVATLRPSGRRRRWRPGTW